jgi:pimeloyl-CoA synthetase
MKGEQMKTIRQIAEEIGVSKTAVRKHMDDSFRKQFAETVSGVVCISEKGEILLKSKFSKNKKAKTKTETKGENFAETEKGVSAVVEILRQELEIKNRQIDALNIALENMSESLKAAQALHGGTMKQALLPENEKAKKRFWFF